MGQFGRRSVVGTFLAAALLVSLPSAGSAQAQRTIVVYAGASLTEAFNAVGSAFTKKSGIVVRFDYAGADALATQIKAGAPADVFASANQLQMNVVADAGLLAAPAKVFAKNRLVLIAPKADDGPVKGLADLAKPGVRVVLEASTVPDGMYTRKAFAMLSGRGDYPSTFPSAVERNVISNELDVKAVVTKIVLGEGDAGVVFATDLTPNVSGKLRSFPFPVAPDIEYPIAALQNATDPQDARAFVAYLLSPEGQSIMRSHGFLAP